MYIIDKLKGQIIAYNIYIYTFIYKDKLFFLSFIISQMLKTFHKTGYESYLLSSQTVT